MQAGGGNTSVKEQGTLWVKASGKWLIHAAQEDMFLPVPLADILRSIEQGFEYTQEYNTASGVLLRPSVETTMHAVIPQPVVVHVHSVRTMALASRADAEQRLAERLSGLRYAWVPYVHPGLPLAQEIQRHLDRNPEVLVLGNHGLVVAAGTCDQAEALLRDVEERLGDEVVSSPAADLDALRRLTSGTPWCLSFDEEAHAIATNPRSCALATGGTMYPDHCVYLGPAAASVRAGEALETAVSRYRARYDYEPKALLVEGYGVIVSPDMSRAARELLLCLKRVVERIPTEAAVHYLEDWQVAKLMNWDAEKYRLAIAQHEG